MDVYKPHEYGKVILPMCVIKRFSDALQETKQAVLDKNDELNARGIQIKDGFLRCASGRLFYSISKFTLEKLKSDPNNIADNFRSYLQGFSDNVIDIIQKFEFDVQVKKMEAARPCSKKASQRGQARHENHTVGNGFCGIHAKECSAVCARCLDRRKENENRLRNSVSAPFLQICAAAQKR
ncbi:MAG: type I restriction-modification system subunit M N-terminal domain-containing protein [Ruminococcus flavefaciens]|nr:type I restriction-modification system subunit M N-terminal domain-containing protein [Ruminococcus flavefaciens]